MDSRLEHGILAEPIRFSVNGTPALYHGSGGERLSRVLRDELGLVGTKIGCDAGDCGACTVLIDDRQVCACLTPVGQVAGRDVQTVEALASDRLGTALQHSFAAYGAAQCGL
jgi:aerobic-type carbon monoxide dehydrogenase small subunit (CoxS/CutS family)